MTKTRSSAEISECGLYRYWLERQWGKEPPQVFVMLNPSTADAETDDQTIRRCISFAKREGAGGLIVVNLFAFRATNPRELFDAADPIGPDNTIAIGRALLMAVAYQRPAICAWGNHRLARAESEVIKRRAFDFNAQLACLGTTKSGAPRHPVRLRSDQPLLPF